MIPKTTIEQILNAAIQAPSGDNCQPWEFEVKENNINLLLVPERDNFLYSWGNRASLIANGAALENILTASSHFGLNANVKFFPEPANKLIVASVGLSENQAPENNLFQSIFKRHSNRKPYKNRALTENEKEQFKNNLADIFPVKILWEYGKEKREILGKAAAANEKILFGNIHMHKFFFDHINWTPEEEAGKKTGFNLNTLELPPPVRPIFKFFKSWKFMLGLNKIGFPSLIAKGNSKLYSTGSAMGLIVIPDNSELSYVKAGMAMEKLWLTATSFGLQFQVLTGICLLMQKIFAGQTSEFSSSQINIIKESYGQITKVFGFKDGEFGALMFRLGESNPPSSITLRQEAKIKFINT